MRPAYHTITNPKSWRLGVLAILSERAVALRWVLNPLQERSGTASAAAKA